MSNSSSRRYAVAALLLVLIAVAFVVFRVRGGKRASAADRTTPASAVPARSAAVAASPGAKPGAATESAATTDFRAALEHARGRRDPAQRSREFGRTLRDWLDRDPAAALAYVRGLPAGRDRTQAVILLLDVVAERDPAQALALARELVTNREESLSYSALFARLGGADPVAAARELAELPAGPGRENAVRALADAWVRRDLAAATTWAEHLAAADRTSAFETMANALAEDDPLHAIDLAQKTLTGPALQRVLAVALHRLMETDVAGAASIVALLPAGDTQTLAAGEVARALAAQNPADALTWVNTLPAGRARQIALNSALDGWAAADPAAAARYVTQLPAGATQDLAAGHLARIFGARAPADAITWAQSLPSATARDGALVAIASAWAQRNPGDAAQWASGLPAGPTQADALNAALSYWGTTDARGAQTFVAALAPSIQAPAAAALAPLLAQTDPLGAVQWAQSLPNSGAREAALTAAFGRWLMNAPAAARAWLAAAHLPAEVEARLLPKS